MKELLKEHDRKFLSLLLQQRHDSISFLVTSCSYVEGFQDPYLFIESEQVTFSSKRHRCDILCIPANLEPTSCRKLKSNVEKLQPVTDDNILSRILGPVVDEYRYFKTRRSIFFLYTTFSSRIAFYAFLCDSYVRTWNTEESTKNVKASVMTFSCSLNNTFVENVPDIDLIGFERMYCRDFMLTVIMEKNL